MKTFQPSAGVAVYLGFAVGVCKVVLGIATSTGLATTAAVEVTAVIRDLTEIFFSVQFTTGFTLHTQVSYYSAAKGGLEQQTTPNKRLLSVAMAPQYFPFKEKHKYDSL